MTKTHYVLIRGPRQVELLESESDLKVNSDQYLVQTECTFISAGTELAIYTGVEPLTRQAGAWCAYPFHPGYANVGRVVSAGDSVRSFKPGMRVLMFRGHASHTVAVEGPTGGIVVEVPEGIEPDVAAASRMAAVATTSIVVAEWGMAPWVAVYGLGPVGNLAAQACGIMGARVIGVDPKAGRRAVAEQCGIKNVIGGSSEEVRQSIRDITGGEMAAISIDAVGHSSVVLEAVRVTKDFGQVLLLGSPRAPVAGNLTELLSALHLHSITMRSALEWCIPIRPDTGVKISHIEKQKAIFDWIRRGVLHVAPLISHRMPPSEIRKAYEGLLEQSDVFTGVALDWRT